MQVEKPSQQYYYYASDQQIELTIDADLLQIHKKYLSTALIPEAMQKEIQTATRLQRKEFLLVHRDDLEPMTLSLLKELSAYQPVFRAMDTVIMVLPEVRVEESRPAEKLRLEKWMRQNDRFIRIQNDRKGRIVMVPTSGQCTDALTIANRLHEEIKPELAQVHLIRVVTRPSVHRKDTVDPDAKSKGECRKSE